MNGRLKGFLLIIIGTVLWGTNGVAMQYLLQEKMFSAGWLTCVRLMSAGIILLAVDKMVYRGKILSIWNKESIKDVIVFSALGMLGTQFTHILTILHSNAATATILQYLMPMVILVYILAVEHRAPRMKESLCILMAMTGTFLLVSKGQIGTLAISGAALFWGILSALAAAVYTLQPRRMLKMYNSSLVVGWGMLSGGMLMSLFYSPFDFSGVFDIGAAMTMVFVVVFGTVIAFWTYIESTKYLYPTEIGTMASIEPFASVLLSIVLLNVAFGVPEIIGSVLIVGTVFILSRK